MFDKVEWELEAYRAQACYLEKERKKAGPKSYEWIGLSHELERVLWNIKELEKMK